MKKLKLNIIPTKKKIKLRRKTVEIPKLGLKHYKMLKVVKGLDENLTELLDSICPGMSAAESDMVMVHLLAHNGKIKEKQTFKYGDTEFEVDINNAYFCNKTRFMHNGVKYIFKEPKLTDRFTSKLEILEKCFVRTEPEVDVNFGEMPAYVLDWADDIYKTIAIDTPAGTIYGGVNIIGKVE